MKFQHGTRTAKWNADQKLNHKSVGVRRNKSGAVFFLLR